MTGRVSIGSVTIDDITSLISAYLSPEASSPRYADMNGDGQISVDDITALIGAYLNASDKPEPLSIRRTVTNTSIWVCP